MAVKQKHPHYYKNVAHLDTIDAYRVLERFGITDPAIQHAVKKLLVAGGRGGGKDIDRDVQEAIDSLQRFQEMKAEDEFENLDTALKASVTFVPETRIPVRETKAQQVRKKMSESTKRDLARRKAAKRVARRTR